MRHLQTPGSMVALNEARARFMQTQAGMVALSEVTDVYNFDLMSVLWGESSADPKAVINYVDDIEETLEGEMRRSRALRSRNLLPTQDLSSWIIQSANGVSVDDIGSRIYRINFGSDYKGVFAFHSNPFVTDDEFLAYADIKTEGAGGIVNLTNPAGNGGFADKNVTVTDAWKPFCASVGSAATGSVGFWFRKFPGGVSSILVRSPNLIKITALPVSEQVPAGNISVGFGDGVELWNGLYDVGFFNTNSYDCVLIDNVSTRTTDWIPVSGGQTYLIKSFGNRLRWQYKIGATCYWGGGAAAGPVPSFFIEKLHADAEFIRIYYDSAATGGVSLQKIDKTNSGLPAVRYFDTDKSGTIVLPSGEVVYGAGQRLDNISIPFGPAATNYLHNSFTAATQTRTLGAGDYCVHLRGSGSIILSGGAVGAVTENNHVTFNLATATSVTFTVAGAIEVFQCNDGVVPISFIRTESGSANADVSQIAYPLNPQNHNPANGWHEYPDVAGYASTDKPTGSGVGGLVSTSGVAANFLFDDDAEGVFSISDGVNTASITLPHTRGDKRLFRWRWSAIDNELQLIGQNITQNPGVWVLSVVVNYAGTFNHGANYEFCKNLDFPTDILEMRSGLNAVTQTGLELV